MNERLTRALINSTYKGASFASKLRRSKETPFFCIVTPVFDPALTAIKTLIADLQDQTFADFKHVLISNGRSPKIANLINKINKKDQRFIYDEITQEKILTSVDLLKNLGKRREFSLKKYIARRYLFFDADLKIIDKHFFAKLCLLPIMQQS